MTNLARSREELAAARNLANSGFPRQAISRAYYAAFYAARAALEAAGEPSPKTHNGLRSRFSDLARSNPRIGAGVGRALSQLGPNLPRRVAHARRGATAEAHDRDR